MPERIADIIDDPMCRDRTRVFRDRAEAGAALARLLAAHSITRGRVLGIPAGGLPVAAVVAEKLALPLDVAVVSKITLPWNTEAGYGAVAFDGSVQLNGPMLNHAGLSKDQVDDGIHRTREKVKARVRRFRGDDRALDVQGETVLLIDDGIASGFTYRAAVEALRRVGAQAIVAAVPTAHRESLERLRAQVDKIVCVNLRAGWAFAVADAYVNWHDVNEDDALALLKRTQQTMASVA